MKELTYILGAGASYQSMPVVKTFVKRFTQFSSEFGGFLQGTAIGNYEKPSGRLIAREFESHQSFDTYFKKLFHTGQESEIRFAKKLLHLYFLWEHLKMPDSNTEIPGVFHKKAKVDKRYDALIAGLLKPVKGKAELFCKTNFITWNYDLNLISSIKQFFYPDLTYKQMFEKVKTDQGNVWNIDDQFSIINMNGYFYSSFLNEEINFNYIDFNQIIKRKITKEYFNDSFVDEDAELIKFAWEENIDLSANSQSASFFAKGRIRSSQNIVIIGYTFPLYNRLSDFTFFNNDFLKDFYHFSTETSPEKGKIYIQDPVSEEIKSGIINQFKFDKGITDRFMTAQKNCDSFFVPGNIVS